MNQQAIEAAAKALYEAEPRREDGWYAPWDGDEHGILSEGGKEERRVLARVALSAALPHLREQGVMFDPPTVLTFIQRVSELEAIISQVRQAHHKDWSDWDGTRPDEAPSCACGYNSAWEECPTVQALMGE